MQRHLACLRCATPMRFAGRKRSHEGARAAAVLLAEPGALFVHRESLDVRACPACGKVEFFLGPAAPGVQDGHRSADVVGGMPPMVRRMVGHATRGRHRR